MHFKWEAFMIADPDLFKNDDVFTKCNKDYNNLKFW